MQFERRGAFLGLIVDEILQRTEITMLQTLKSMIGDSGIGLGFEYTTHRSILQSISSYWCLQLNGTAHNSKTAIKISLNGLVVRHVRTIADLTSLAVGEYGLPTISSFPFGGAFVRLEDGRLVVIQATISDKHKADVTKRNKIASSANVKKDKMVLLVILPVDKIPWFSYNDTVNDMPQYISTCVPQATDAAIIKLRTKKRSIGLI